MSDNGNGNGNNFCASNIKHQTPDLHKKCTCVTVDETVRTKKHAVTAGPIVVPSSKKTTLVPGANVIL